MSDRIVPPDGWFSGVATPTSLGPNSGNGNGGRQVVGRPLDGGNTLDVDAHPRRNRVTPLGDIVAIPLRGAWLGNRGNLHRGHEIVRYTRNRAWITCALQYKNWSIPQWAPGHYTVLFFHDEAVSLAAGHRPCALCRRPAYNDFRAASVSGTGEPPPGAVNLDRQLHSERLIAGTHRRKLHRMDWELVPDGAFVIDREQPCLVLKGAVIPWTTNGYTAPLPCPGNGTALVLTPPTSIRALIGGYPVQIDPGPPDRRRPLLSTRTAQE